MKVAVIGAGLSGLNSARILSEYCNVDVYEKNRIGGLASSYCTGTYCIEAFYHHFFRSDSYLLHTLKELNLGNRIVWRVVKVGQVFNGRIYSLSTPLEILEYPGMSFLEKIRLARFTVNARKRNYRMFDDVGVMEGLERDVGKSLTEKFFLPLLRSKFGDNFAEVSYAWLLARVSLRSNRKLRGEELGYLRGGFQTLVDALSENLNIIHEKARISRSGKWEVNGRKYDAVIFTAPLDGIESIAGIDFEPGVRYQSSICLLMGMNEPFHEDIYWINYESEPFGATIEHTNFMDFDDYGEHLMYVASYTTPERVFERSDEEIFRLYVKSLSKYGLESSQIKWWRIFRAKYSGPVYEKGYLGKITPYRLFDNFYAAGMTSMPNYPERSMNGSLLAGKEVAERVIEDHLS